MRSAAIVGLALALGAGGAVAARQRGGTPERDRAREVTRRAVLEIEDARAPHPDDLRTLALAARGQDPQLQLLAIRAIGRLERRDAIPELLPLLTTQPTRAEAANAIAQSLRGPALSDAGSSRRPSSESGQLEQAVVDALLAAGAQELTARAPIALSAVARSLGRIPHASAAQRQASESFLRRILETTFRAADDEPHIGAARGLESLARINRKVHRLSPETIEKLQELALISDPLRVERRRNVLLALAAAQGIDLDVVRSIRAGDLEARRVAVMALAGAGLQVPGDERLRLIRQFLEDDAPLVRFEAVRAWAARGAASEGCGPLVEALTDPHPSVSLAALDALGDQCNDDPGVTERLATAARPDNTAAWQRRAHALVALAKRAPDRAAVHLDSFSRHQNWQLRLYAARVAVLLGDVAVLTRLAGDEDDNVVEAALPALRERSGSETDAIVVAALGRKTRIVGRHQVRPYQAVLAAATALQGAAATPALVGALSDALERISEERCETSRDVRLALIARLSEMGSAEQAGVLSELLTDIDPVVAAAAGVVVTKWTGKPAIVDPPERAPRPAPADSGTPTEAVRIEMEDGRHFELRFFSVAPYASARFLELARIGYYDRLAFQRVVPNFVIQGGGPNANEYCGDCPFARDEVGLVPHRRGTVGISTRGRDTGDSQIFVNLVDSPRLDHTYTVFAYVCDGMEVVESIQEGDRMQRLSVVTPAKDCTPPPG